MNDNNKSIDNVNNRGSNVIIIMRRTRLGTRTRTIWKTMAIIIVAVSLKEVARCLHLVIWVVSWIINWKSNTMVVINNNNTLTTTITITISHNNSNKWAHQNSANSAESAKPAPSVAEKPNTPLINNLKMVVINIWSYCHVTTISKINHQL